MHGTQDSHTPGLTNTKQQQQKTSRDYDSPLVAYSK